MGTKHKSRFLVKQRAFLKIYLIYMAEKEKLYGLQFQETIREEFMQFGYRPNHSEIYKSLHELIEEGILKRMKTLKQGMKFQEVIYYRIQDREKANLYKKQLKVELDRCHNMLGKAIADIYG
ncbi:helix-turn-helix transcriptional regulator [Bacillus cereus]|uniref:helix-turn-helix transcriptional regulator n=1 Tax=Bacillus cereus TaxID=1396 RepID=UPI000B4B21C7|nr:helix-turn-helix transcriptional regulator [Bacillus cereus]